MIASRHFQKIWIYFDKESEEGLLLIYQCEVGVG